MPFSPFPAGDGRAWTNTLTTDSAAFNLTGVANNSIALHMEDINNGNALYVCTGAWNVTNATSGIATFTPSVADLLATNPLGKPGMYKVYPVVTLNTGPVAMDSQIMQVVSLP